MSRRQPASLSRQGSSLAEFAISLPLLVVLVVGIFDFGGAFNQKQQLTNAMREAARFGASQPTNDLAVGTVPPSVDAIRYLVDAYLQSSRMNDCGLATTSASITGPPWTYTTSGSCSLTLTISRDPQSGSIGTGTVSATCAIQAGNYGSPNAIPVIALPCTRVQISYPYQWHFNSVIQLLVPGANLALTQISANATVVNTN